MSKIDYDIRQIKAVVFDIDGVLSPSTVPMAANGEPQRMVNVKDGYAMHLAAKCGFNMAIISGGRGESITLRYKNLGLKDIYLSCGEKLPILKAWMQRHGLKANEVAFVGDDIPDIPAMKTVGLPIAPRDAAMEVKAVARYITSAEGGYGVARELLQEILSIRGMWLNDTKAFGW